MPSSVLVRRARSRSPPGMFDSARRTRPRVEDRDHSGKGCTMVVSTLPDDVLVEVFKRLPPPADAIRCAAVCRRWRRVVSGAARCLAAPPGHFGFFHNYGPSPLPPFVPTAGVGLDLGFLPVPSSCGAILVDCRGRHLLLRKIGLGFPRQLKLLVCNPLEKTYVDLPPLYIAGHKVACCVVVPGDGAAFRVVVVLFGAAPAHFDVLIYTTVSQNWEAATGRLRQSLSPQQGPSIVVGDVVYKLQSKDKYILTVDTIKMTLSAVAVPNAGILLYAGNHWIGKTEDGRVCFFAIRDSLSLAKWVLQASGEWMPQQPVALGPMMNPVTFGDLLRMKLSAKISDQLHGYKLVSFGGFCEGSGTLFFIMAERVVSLNLETWKMERLWRNTDKWRPLGDVYPYEMVWPPVLKDFAKPPVLDEM